MPDTIIVTICYQDKRYDFELPSRLPRLAWEESFRLLLKDCFPGISLEGKTTELFFDGKKIEKTQTLEQWGIYDGSYLTLKTE